MTTQLQYGMDGDRPYGLYYQHSGRTPISAVLLAGLAGAAAAIIVGIGYAYLVEYVPYIKLRFIATMAFGALVGFVTARIAKAGKVRSLSVGLAISGVATLAGYYVCWLVWVKNLLGDNATYGQLILQPAFFCRVIQLINLEGVWRMSKSDTENVKGIFLTLIWFGEAASIFGCSLGLAFGLLREEMFCESCNHWCGKPGVVRQVVIGDPIRLKQTLESHDFSYLDSLEATAGDRHWEVCCDYCSSCNRLHALSIKQKLVTRNKKGAVTGQKKSTLVNRLLLDDAEAQALRAGPAAGLGQAPPPTPVSNTPTAPDGAA
jgi:hypothetical protein